MSEFTVKFRGTRGSHPVAAGNKLKYGGNTACVEIRANGHTIILDAGTGIIEAGNDLVKSHIASGTNIENRNPIQALILFSHSHLDHIQGLPFFKPLYIKSSKLCIFGGKTHGKDYQQLLSDMVFGSVFPVELSEIAADTKFYDFKETDAIVLNPDSDIPQLIRFDKEKEIILDEKAVVITCMKCNAHPKAGVLVFKIRCNGKTLVYATDKEDYIGGDIQTVNFSRGASMLIHDAQYTMEDYISPVSPKQGFGHSTIEMAIETAKQANVSQLILFHMDPAYDDNLLEKLEEKARGIFQNAMFARENLEINLMQVKCKV